MATPLPPALIVEVLQALLPEGYAIVRQADLTRATGEDLVTEKELAAELEVTVSTLRRWRRDGEGPAFVKVLGFRAPRYRRRDLENWKAGLPGLRSTVEARARR